MLPVLPPEILEAIVDDVDPTKLNALSLTCRALRGPVQRRRFRTLRLKSRIRASHLLKPLCLLTLCEILTVNPTIRSYIRVLEIYPSDGLIEASLTSSAGLISATLHLLSTSPIHTLRFTSDTSLKWSEVPQNIQTAVFEILKNPAFHTLELDGLIVPRHFFSKITNLQRLTFTQYSGFIGYATVQDATRKMKTYEHNLTQLSVSLPPPTAPNYQAHVDPINSDFGVQLSRLRSLELSFHFIQRAAVLRFFEIKGLRDLKITVTPPATTIWEPTIPLSALNHLRTLTITQTLVRWTKECFSWIGYTLATLTTRSLELLALKFEVHPAALVGGVKTLKPLVGYLELVSGMMLDRGRGRRHSGLDRGFGGGSAIGQRGLRVHDQNQMQLPSGSFVHQSDSQMWAKNLQKYPTTAFAHIDDDDDEMDGLPLTAPKPFRIHLEFNFHCPVELPPALVVQFSEDVRKKIRWEGCEDVLESIVVTPGFPII